MDQIRKFTSEFFDNLKCDVCQDGNVLMVKNVPRSFEDLVGKKSPYKLSFVPGVKDSDFVGKGSVMLSAMVKYLEGAGKASILKIDFNIDAEKEIKNRVGFKNCELDSLVKKYHNGFFSRFTFSTSFNYLNESEKLLNEVYIYKGKVVEGDLSGYSIVEGEGVNIDNESVRRDYLIAKERILELASEKQAELGGILKEKVEKEIERIKKHYNKALGECSGDLNEKLKHIREIELRLRSCEDNKKDELRKKLVRLRDKLVKIGDDEVVERILKERDLTIRDVMHKYSLNVDRKLMNTTVIYYPIYSFRLCLKGCGVSKLVDVKYDPLTKKFSGLNCESCSCRLDKVNLCENGHLSCGDCLRRCGECGGIFCNKCLKKSCSVCGIELCCDCSKLCLKCGKIVCSTHFRKDCVSGEERCVSCLRACLRCQGLSEERFFGEALDGSKVCEKCLGRERSGKILKRVFKR